MALLLTISTFILAIHHIMSLLSTRPASDLPFRLINKYGACNLELGLCDIVFLSLGDVGKWQYLAFHLLRNRDFVWGVCERDGRFGNSISRADSLRRCGKMALPLNFKLTFQSTGINNSTQLPFDKWPNWSYWTDMSLYGRLADLNLDWLTWWLTWKVAYSF